MNVESMEGNGGSLKLNAFHFKIRWKELFPEILKLLSEMPKITVHNEIKTGNEYCESIVKTLLSLRWPETVLSSIGAMFL